MYYRVRRWRQSPTRTYMVGGRRMLLPKPITPAMKRKIGRKEYEDVIRKVLVANGWVYRGDETQE